MVFNIGIGCGKEIGMTGPSGRNFPTNIIKARFETKMEHIKEKFEVLRRSVQEGTSDK
jgi:hypothetical protein